MPETVVMLHGFSGTRRAWDGVSQRLDPERYLPLAIDLPGHGEDSSNTGPISFADCVQRVLSLAPERFALCGYSLGGRVALHVALAAPERITSLIIISSSPGIEDPAERADRRRADRQLADELESIPFEDFIERWRTQPLFAGDPPAVGELARADQRRNRPESLAAALRGIGTGEMEPLWSRLAELSMPVRLVVGARDAKFLNLAQRALGLLANGSLTVLSGGHGLVLEEPDGVAAAIVATASG